MTKEEIMNNMIESPEGFEMCYALTEHIGVNIVVISYKKAKWYLEVWNDYQDYVEFQKQLSEHDALNCIESDLRRKL